jgi:hypothetical protein
LTSTVQQVKKKKLTFIGILFSVNTTKELVSNVIVTFVCLASLFITMLFLINMTCRRDK